jgi:hypothetical protein
MTMTSLRNGPPSKDPRKHGNVYQLAASRVMAEHARDRATEALRDVRVLYWQVGILWAGIIALALKVCL